MNRYIRKNVSSSPFQPSTVSMNEKLQARQVKRAAKATERKQKSDKFKDDVSGNTFFRTGDYIKAADCYQQAIQVHGAAAKPVLLVNLAAAYLKLEMFGEAHTAAERALEADPKSIKARFRRGVARRHMEMMTAAAIDFRTVLSLDPGNIEAKQELALVEEASPDYDFYEGVASYSDDEAPAPDNDGCLIDSMSESSDCEHKGNGVPCKFYNHTGCAKRGECRFSHAPDNQSVRDRLGRNVCMYYLMGNCKFGAEKCYYLHSKEFLPQRGWWTTPEGVTQAQKLYNVRKMINKALNDSGHGSKSTKYPKPRTRGTSKKPQTGKKSRVVPSAFYDLGPSGLSDADSNSEEEYNEFGFTEDDM